MKVAIDCPSLDEMLDGGIESGCITLLFGEAGSGKTNLCLQLSRSVVQSNKKVLYLDTEGVSLERFKQICGRGYNSVLKDVLFSEIFTLEEQEDSIEKASGMTEVNREIGLIVLDSATTHYRRSRVMEDEWEGLHSLTRQVTKLMEVARKRDIPVVLTSQVYTDIDRGTFEPLGGHMLSHNAKDIIRLAKVAPNLRAAIIVKHRHIEEGVSAKFRITDRGLES